MRVAVVEIRPDVREALVTSLQRGSHTVQSFERAESLLNHVANRGPFDAYLIGIQTGDSAALHAMIRHKSNALVCSYSGVTLDQIILMSRAFLPSPS